MTSNGRNHAEELPVPVDVGQKNVSPDEFQQLGSLLHQYKLEHLGSAVAQSAANQPETPGQTQSLSQRVLWVLLCAFTQRTGPTVLRPIRRTKQLWLSALLKDTIAMTGNRTHAPAACWHTRT